MTRLREIQIRFPNMTVDLTFLESQEDLQVSRGGLSSTGFRRSDVSTIIRARDCSSSICETVFVEDYRYETGLLASDVTQWYRLIAILRATGQVYFWLRGIGLILSCYFIHHSQQNVSIWVRLRKARHLFLKVPTQCVVYGSSFPVLCYVLAHLLDAPFTYNVLEGHFFSQAGVLDINPSQYRSTSFRSSKILRIMELPINIGRAWETAKYQYSFGHRGRGSVLLGGVLIDLKFLICLLFLLVALWAVHVIYSIYRELYSGRKHSHWLVLPPTPAPYSAGKLWPIVSVCVQWPSNYYCIRDTRHRGPAILQVVQQNQFRHRYPFRSRLLKVLGWTASADARVFAAATNAHSKYIPDEELRIKSRLSGKIFDMYQFIQHRFKCLHRRSATVEADVAFMNAVLMSDPLVYLGLKMGSDFTLLGYYQSIWHPSHIVLLPVAVVGDHNEYTSDLKLVHCVYAYELPWTELVQCG
ncbi:hypothetical protein V7S43_012918 [Phytophthora oleae]|uniref:Uncharacterized protein n=1 Tax=Phytophthora oleae TaxID=2107226 RepID=A0ABD3F5K6_9STRA